MNTKKYWIAVVAVLIIGFSILGYLGTDVYHQAPPVPTAYVSQDGQVLFTKEDIYMVNRHGNLQVVNR